MNDVQNLKNILSRNLKTLLFRKGKTQTDLANDLDIPEMTVSNWMNAKTYPRPDKIQLMADYFNVLRSAITEEIQPTNIVLPSSQAISIPVVGQIACGDPILSEENIIGYRDESLDRLPSGSVFYLVAKGTSMEPTIPNGSYVLIREQPEVEYGEIAAVLVNGDSEATLKRVRKQGEFIMLMPDNPAHDPIIITKDNPARIIGKAVRYTQDL